MKKPIFYLSILFLLTVSGTYLSSCGSHDHDDHEHSTEEVSDHDDDSDHEIIYQCPMKCEGEKTYAESGTCPSCGMDLEQIAELHSHDDDEDSHDHDH